MLRSSTSSMVIRTAAEYRSAGAREFASSATSSPASGKITTKITTSKLAMRGHVALNAGKELKDALVGKNGAVGQEGRPGMDHRMESEKIKAAGMAAGGASRFSTEHSN